MQTIAERLNSARKGIDQAANSAHRPPNSVKLLAVSKTKPVSDIKNIERQIADRLLGESYDHRNKPNYSTIATARMDLENILTTYEVDLDDLNNKNNSNPDLSKEKFQTLVSSWKYIEEKEKELEGML